MNKDKEIDNWEVRKLEFNRECDLIEEQYIERLEREELNEWRNWKSFEKDWLYTKNSW